MGRGKGCWKARQAMTRMTRRNAKGRDETRRDEARPGAMRRDETIRAAKRRDETRRDPTQDASRDNAARHGTGTGTRGAQETVK